MDNYNIALGHFVILQKQTDSSTRLIHEGGRFDEEVLVSMDRTNGYFRVKTTFQMEFLKTEVFAEKMKCPKTRIMSSLYVLLTRVSETDDEFHN